MSLTKAKKRKLLARARDLIARPNGWRRGGFNGVRKGYQVNQAYGVGTTLQKVDARSFCLAGALSQAALELDIDADEIELCDALSIATLAKAKLADRPRLFALVESGEAYPVFAFNDSPATRKKDVIALLDEKLAEVSS